VAKHAIAHVACAVFVAALRHGVNTAIQNYKFIKHTMGFKEKHRREVRDGYLSIFNTASSSLTVTFEF
jgi:hypothetical protein